MKKKLLGILLCSALLVSVVGCGKKEEANNKNNENDKQIVCTGEAIQTSEDELVLKQSYLFNFKDDTITTFEIVQNLKLLKETSALKEQFDAANEAYYRDSFKSMYEYAEAEAPDFDVKVKDISSLEKEITITLDFKEYIKSFESEEDEDIAQYTHFDDFSKYVINEIADEDMTCTYNGKVISTTKDNEE